MKKIFSVVLAAVLCATACHKPEFVPSNADRQGLTSLTAVILNGKYAEQVLTKLEIDEAMYQDGNYVIEIPFYYPETSEDETITYLTGVRVQAELQPNFKINPTLEILDLSEVNEFTLTAPDGTTRPITITGKRVKSKKCQLLSMLVEDVMTSAVIYEDQHKILIPFLDDLSNVTISGSVSSHAKIQKVNGKAYDYNTKYNLNAGATITVVAMDGTTTCTYTIEKGIPKILEQGMNMKSIAKLFTADAVTVGGLPPYDNVNVLPSIAGLGNYLVVSNGDGTAPAYLDCFTGKNLGTINLGTAEADCITNDDCGHMLLCGFAEKDCTLNVYTTSSVTSEPVLFYSFVNPCPMPIGHTMKVLGDITSSAVIVFTAEGLAGVSVASQVVVLYVDGGAVTSVQEHDFAPVLSSFAGGWGAAPVDRATVVPASLKPERDGWFFDYYQGNCDESVGAECYILHYVDGLGKDKVVDYIGTWAEDPNCLDLKTFNGCRYMALFTVSHFPVWEIPSRLYLYEVTTPSVPTQLLSNTSIPLYHKGSYLAEAASGDVVLFPTPDGYRLYLYFYDHHTQTIGAYVVDCFDV